MPTYVYECKNCLHRFEIFQSFSAQKLTTCPECEEVSLRKVLFPAGVVFKGSGFYVNDSRGSRPKDSTTVKKSESKDTKADAEKGSASSNGSTSKKERAASGAGKES